MTHSRHPPRLQYWMSINYDANEDGANKKSHFLFSFLVSMVSLFNFFDPTYCQKYIRPTSFSLASFGIITPFVK